MAFEVKSEIMSAIAKTDDSNLKMLLLLMLGVLEEIGGRIDAMRADERGLRDAVLNGHADVHHDHHEWVAEKIEAEKQDAKDAAELSRAGRRAAVEQATRAVVLAAASLIAGAMGALHFVK